MVVRSVYYPSARPVESIASVGENVATNPKFVYSTAFSIIGPILPFILVCFSFKFMNLSRLIIHIIVDTYADGALE